MKIKIIMLSGGYDSVGLLFWAIGHSDWHIVAHHIELRNSEKRWEMESKSINAVIDYAKREKIEFEYSSSKIENMDPYFCGRDIVNVGFMAAIVATASFIKYKHQKPEIEVFTGGTIEDHVQSQMDTHDGIWKKTAIFNAQFADWPAHIKKPTIRIPFEREPKTKIAKFIPKEIMKKIWTCRNPIKTENGIIKCNLCISCYRERLLEV